MNGFFPTSTLVSRKPLTMVPKCGECGIYKRCANPKLPVWGQGRKKIMFVLEVPDDTDTAKRRLASKVGQWMNSILNRMGVHTHTDCWWTHAIICLPDGGYIKNRSETIDHCRPNLLNAIKEHDPNVIVLFGDTAIRSLIGHMWKPKTDDLEKWVGWQIPGHEPNAWVCPTWSPYDLLANENRVRDMFFRNHLEAAIRKASRKPWKVVPNYKGKVLLEYDDKKVAKYIRGAIAEGCPVAFDYETTMLKPDHERARIVSCSVSDGTDAIAFPWGGEESAEALRELLRSKSPKVASNMKFEARWSKKFLGTWMRNHKKRNVDTMLLSHVLDNRPGINSIKFQAFVRLGQPEYDGHIKPFLEAEDDGGYSVNRIHEVDLDELLLYNGLDSLLEWEVAKLQNKELGREKEEG